MVNKYHNNMKHIKYKSKHTLYYIYYDNAFHL